MLLKLAGHSFRFECENLCRLFFPYSPVRVQDQATPQPPAAPDEPWASVFVEETPAALLLTIQVSQAGEAPVLHRAQELSQLAEYPVTRLLYQLLSELTGVSPAWGMLTGVHPVKLLRQHTERLGQSQGAEDFRRKWMVSPQRAELAMRVLLAQREAADALLPQDFSLYVGIPFCPSRCSYCSFISQDMKMAQKLIEPYVQALHIELQRVGEITARLGMRLVSLYIGGGTPTSLSAQQLSALFDAIHRSFDMSSCIEFTVEAGRPDSITREKLLAIKAAGAGRVSVNPQSMSDQVLKNIGRNHTARQVADAFELVHSVGFEDINADLIVGLPGDSLSGFTSSLQQVLDLSPTNITVHSLALKRSSNLVTEDGDLSSHMRSGETARMMDHSIQRLTDAGFVPYYLYRQTRMSGNLENTGWAKPSGCGPSLRSHICRYNVYTMDESGTVIACGAGGVTKIKDPYSDNLQRIFNFKYPLDYISRHREILERKDGMEAILSGLLRQS